jgi:acyl-coenzyme A synthetase/AMP-(fatty) acid ligase
MTLFWIDPANSIKKTYSELMQDVRSKSRLNKYIYYKQPYQVFLDLITGLAGNKEVHLLDADFSATEIENLGISASELNQEELINLPQIPDFPALLAKLNENRSKSQVVIYTSGTTGRPKKVTHTLQSLARTAKTGDKFIGDIWGFAYNPTHFAGIQVFLQAFLNMNPLVNVFELSGDELYKAFTDYKITNISATPTYYRRLLTDIHTPLPSVNRCTMGGEKYDPSLEGSLKKIFSAAVIRNIYASTEAGSLFNSKDDIFEIEESRKKYIRISPEGELLVHKEMLGGFDSQDLQDGWYHSGDLVESLDNNRFRFISRKSEMINVGGYKVNPHEVEEEIRKVDGVRDVRVSPRANRLTGYILMAEVVKDEAIENDLLEKRILSELQSRLQNFKIPRIVRFVPELQLTRTGKKERL